MQDHRTTSLEIHDGATSSAEQLSQTDSSSRSVYTSTQDWVYIRWFGEAGGGVALDVDFTFFREAGKFGQMGLREGDLLGYRLQLCARKWHQPLHGQSLTLIFLVVSS